MYLYRPIGTIVHDSLTIDYVCLRLREFLCAEGPAGDQAARTWQDRLRRSRLPGRVPLGMGSVPRERNRLQQALGLRCQAKSPGLIRQHDSSHGCYLQPTRELELF